MTDHEQGIQIKKNLEGFFLGLDFIVLILSIAIPFVLVYLNQAIHGCGQHMFSNAGSGAYGWMWGRSLGFTCFIWFIYAMIKGFSTKKVAKLIKNMKSARNFHCRTAIISIFLLSLHVIILITSNPWKWIIFSHQAEHFPYSFYMIKIWTGIVYGAIMVISSVMFIYLRDLNRLKKFGYKRFMWVHHVMLICAIILIIHIFFINTELWLAFVPIGDD